MMQILKKEYWKLPSREKFIWYIGALFEFIMGIFLWMNYKDYNYKIIGTIALVHALFVSNTAIFDIMILF
jgi:hypothetical protein